jgi:polyisoprenoid-binding protein YceI
LILSLNPKRLVLQDQVGDTRPSAALSVWVRRRALKLSGHPLFNSTQHFVGTAHRFAGRRTVLLTSGRSVVGSGQPWRKPQFCFRELASKLRWDKEYLIIRNQGLEPFHFYREMTVKLSVPLMAVAVTMLSTICMAQETETEQRSSRPKLEAVDVTSNKPVKATIDDGKVKLSPENSKVEFVGTHTGDDPRPRLGGFARFRGLLTMADEGASVQSLELEFDTTSLWTQLGGKLTDHLKTADFLDVEKYPTAKFVSKKIAAAESKGVVNVVGDFTLMDKTNEITLPAEFKVEDGSLTLKSELSIDRTVFGMTKMTEGVSKEVAITFVIGERTRSPGAGQMAGRARGQRGRFDPAAMFKQQDADGDGKLTGDEIPKRMQQNIKIFDGDGDGSITMEEIHQAMQAFQQGAGAPDLSRPGAGRTGGDQGGKSPEAGKQGSGK